MVKRRTVTPAIKLAAEEALKSADKSVTIDWDNCYEEKCNTRAPVTCNKHLTTVTRSVNDLKKGKYKCVGCVEDARNAEARKKGFTIVQKLLGDKYKVSCNTCGESKIVGVTCLYEHSGIFCVPCSINKYKVVLEKNKCTFLSWRRKGVYILIRYIDINGAEHETIASDILRLKFKFKKLWGMDKYKAKVENSGFDFISKVDEDSIKVRCREDGTERKVSLGVVRKGKIFCYACRHRRIESALTRRGCKFGEYVKTENRGKKVTYLNKEGEVFTASMGRLQKGKFATSKKGHWFASHSVYLIRVVYNDDTYYKIGTAINPECRMADLKLLGKVEVFTLATLETRALADRLEKSLHKEFKLLNLDSAIAATFTTKIIKRKRAGKSEKTAVKDGIHEWFFGEEVFQTLVSRYKLKEENYESNSSTTNQVNYTR